MTEVKETKVESQKTGFVVKEGCTSLQCTSGTLKGVHPEVKHSWVQSSSTAGAKNPWIIACDV